jgi:hypothetical protein
MLPELPEDATVDFEEPEPPEDASIKDDWWLIVRCIASGERNIGLMTVGIATNLRIL